MRVFFGIGILAVALAACSDHRPRLQIYMASKEPREGLHEANFPNFPKVGYIAQRPDLTISELLTVSFGPPVIVAPDAVAPNRPMEDRGSLVLRLTSEDADALQKLTSAHVGDRLLVLLNDEPLFAPEIRNPSNGQSVYITAPQRGETPKFKEKLEALVQKPK
jgi:preprotein translocase subunit SecD